MMPFTNLSMKCSCPVLTERMLFTMHRYNQCIKSHQSSHRKVTVGEMIWSEGLKQKGTLLHKSGTAN